MTIATAIERARRWARITETSHTDAQVIDAINDGQREFAKECKGLSKEEYLQLAPLFDTKTWYAIRLTITGGTNALAATDVVITSTNRSDTSGTTIAADLQTAIQAAGAASATVAWSTTSWVFTIDSSDGTQVAVTDPTGITYASAVDLLFGGCARTQTGSTFTGSLPEDCTVEVSLPSDYNEIIPPVEWDGNKLYSANWDIFTSPQSFGSHPTHFGIRNKKLRLYPSPSSQKILQIWYEYIPTDFASGYQECGLSGKFSSSATGLSATTQYYFKVTIDGGSQTEWSITTAADLTYDAVIDLLNAASIGCTWSLVDGDLRCTSDTPAGSSSIALAAGTTGTNLFATLTGFSAFDTAVAAAGGSTIAIPSPYETAPVYYAASTLAEEQHEYDVADRMYAQFRKRVTDYTVAKNNESPKMSGAPVRYIPPIPRVIT